ncbi:MAG: glycerol kinase GlpK [Clostridiales Family XIII bacterium]|jgi:glycerol kinase|nr:glycerol kinase GlpK [Clostridiales Family XIII bacterium]
MKQYIMAFDQGTTGSRCIIFDKSGDEVASASREFTQIYPQEGWVEHDPMEIWSTQINVAQEALLKAQLPANAIASIGITNQRETTILWDAETGEPVYNAIVWQCRRTSGFCDQLKKDGLSEFFRERTGLILDAYFSATKIRWILDHVPGVRARADAGKILFGTVETWLIWKLTNGRVHITDYSNASRTMLFNIHTLTWDDTILETLNIPRSMLPTVKASSEVYGLTDAPILGGEIPISGAAGDQQASLFGQACFEQGDIKNTYGTGCFMLMNTGNRPVVSSNGLLTTIAWGISGQVSYALEGSVFAAGAAVQWLRDELGLIHVAADSEAEANRVADNGGVYIVPAFVGLGAPYWDPYARGTIVGLTRGSNRHHLVRATLESIAYQNYDLLGAMRADIDFPIRRMKVDGGASANNFLMQFQSDILQIPVLRAACIETTALGAAYLAGLAVGYWESRAVLQKNWHLGHEFVPTMQTEKRAQLLLSWEKAIGRSLSWINT